MTPAEKLKLAERLTLRREATDEERVDVVDNFYLPGEKVRSNPGVKYVHETSADARARHDVFGERELTIKATILEADRRIQYAFEGIGGEHNAKGFMDPNGFEHHYGVLAVVDGTAWLVPMTSDLDDPKVAGPARRLDLNLSRYGLNAFGGQTPTELLAYYEGEPGIGEYVVVQTDEDLYRLEASPWQSGANAHELRLATEAVARADIDRVMASGPSFA